MYPIWIAAQKLIDPIWIAAQKLIDPNKPSYLREVRAKS